MQNQDTHSSRSNLHQISTNGLNYVFKLHQAGSRIGTPNLDKLTYIDKLTYRGLSVGAIVTAEVYSATSYQ